MVATSKQERRNDESSQTELNLQLDPDCSTSTQMLRESSETTMELHHSHDENGHPSDDDGESHRSNPTLIDVEGTESSNEEETDLSQRRLDPEHVKEHTIDHKKAIHCHTFRAQRHPITTYSSYHVGNITTFRWDSHSKKTLML